MILVSFSGTKLNLKFGFFRKEGPFLTSEETPNRQFVPFQAEAKEDPAGPG